MRQWIFTGFAAAALLAAPGTASALSIEASLGTGVGRASSGDFSDTNRIATNVMVTPGIELLGMLDLQLGLLADLGDVENSDFDFQLRPQIKISPPVLPVYGRVIFSVVNLLGDGDTQFSYGAGLGLSLPIPVLAPFVEAAVLPTTTGVDGLGLTIYEFRAGVAF